MGKVTRKRYGADSKAKVALDAIKGELTPAELASKYGIHQTMIACMGASNFPSIAFSSPSMSDEIVPELGHLLGPQHLLEQEGGHRRFKLGDLRLGDAVVGGGGGAWAISGSPRS